MKTIEALAARFAADAEPLIRAMTDEEMASVLYGIVARTSGKGFKSSMLELIADNALRGCMEACDEIRFLPASMGGEERQGRLG